MKESMSSEEIDRLYMQGDRCFHQGEFITAVDKFELLLQIIEPGDRLYFNTQRTLVKAYQQNQQLEKAILLCQEIAASGAIGDAMWGQTFLAKLDPDYQKPVATSSDSDETRVETRPKPSLKPKTLAQFKRYCQNNLLGDLQELESKRKYTLASMLISGILCLILAGCFCLGLSNWLRVNTSFEFYLFCLVFPFTAWILFCRSCIQVYGLGFKRNIIENIVNFIDDHGQLEYAAHLFLEDKRRTINSLTRSQILGDALSEPDDLEQEDCIYGRVGDTDLFFAEITAKKIRGGHLDELGMRQSNHESILFQGLFFEAKFAKSFNSRTFVMPNNFKQKLEPLNRWRGELIKLEDPEFERRFRVYGDSQIESRYILSTNLMNRLVEFNKKAKRKVYLSFVDGYVYLAIPYNYNLFEPKLWKNMTSFTPLKEYFQDLQLMIGTVEDLNLNRRIWG